MIKNEHTQKYLYKYHLFMTLAFVYDQAKIATAIGLYNWLHFI